MKAIEKTAENGQAYFELGKKVDHITLLNGTALTKKQLFFKAIEYGVEDSDLYYSLGDLLEENDAILLPNGDTVDAKTFLIKAVSLPFENKWALGELYLTLGLFLTAQEEIVLLDGTHMTNQALFLKALEMWTCHTNNNNNIVEVHPCRPFVYYALGEYLESGQEVVLPPNGERAGKRDLYLKAIDYSGLFVRPRFYLALGLDLEKEEKITLLNGKETTKRDLLIPAIKEPHGTKGQKAVAYQELGRDLICGETIALFGKTMDSIDLFLKALDLDPELPIPYLMLGHVLGKDEEVDWLDGERVSRNELFCRGWQKSHNRDAVVDFLKITLPIGETVTLPDGTQIEGEKKE